MRTKPGVDLPFAEELRSQLADLEAQGLLRAAHRPPEGAVSFASNDYLGLRTDPRVVRAVAAAAERWGAGSGSSRLIAGTTEPAMQLEAALAAFKRHRAALVFSTGYQAAAGTISALVGPGDEVFLDRLDHASLIDGARLSGARLRTYRHACPDRLKALLDRPAEGRRLVVTDGLFSMDGDVAPLREIGELCARYGAGLMVDEAHGTGCLGEKGRGAAEALDAEDLVHVSMGTLSKALGSLGGFVCASETVVETLVNRARGFIYTTAPAPAQLGAALAALEIVRAEPQRRERLAERSGLLRSLLPDAGFDIGTGRSHIVPVVLGANDAALRAAAFLLSRGYHCPAVRYPTVPKGSARLRLSVSSEHTPEQVRGLVDALVAWRKSGG